MKAMAQIRIALMLSSAIYLVACQTVVPKDYSKLLAEKPRSILIVPATNRSTTITAPDYFLSTISLPVAEHGYYVFPINTVKHLLEDEGLSDADLVHNAPATKLGQMFGADSILYIEIKDWTAEYVLLLTTIKVHLVYTLKSGKTGDTLWEDDRFVAYTPQSSSSSGGLLGVLVSAAITAAVAKAAPNYIELANRANDQAFTYPGPGVPPGPYLPSH